MPSIPIPIKGDNDSMHQTAMALKQATEMLMGTRGGAPVTRTYVQEDMPAAINSGDQWIQPSSNKMSYWDGSRWQQIKGA
jgi:hypothetical protein